MKTSFLAAVIAPVPSLTSYSFTQTMLILILINDQYLQNVAFSFDKG